MSQEVKTVREEGRRERGTQRAQEEGNIGGGGGRVDGGAVQRYSKRNELRRGLSRRLVR